MNDDTGDGEFVDDGIFEGIKEGFRLHLRLVEAVALAIPRALIQVYREFERGDFRSRLKSSATGRGAA